MLALLGPREMSDLSPQSGPKRTMIPVAVTNRDFMSLTRAKSSGTSAALCFLGDQRAGQGLGVFGAASRLTEASSSPDHYRRARGEGLGDELGADGVGGEVFVSARVSHSHLPARGVGPRSLWEALVDCHVVRVIAAAEETVPG